MSNRKQKQSLEETQEIVAQHYAVAMPSTGRGAAAMHENDPVARQYQPDLRELLRTPQELDDPIGDDRHSPVKGIVHRYPDRVLFKPVHVCAAYCRFCFRREMVGPGQKGLNDAEIDEAIAYIAQNQEIWEVILTGGDPLVLSRRRLQQLLDRLCAIEHVQIIRIHTRVPVADPARITPELCAVLQREKAVYVSLHINHAQEITPAVKTAISMLRRADCVLISQSVLLRGVNDNPKALEDLFRALVALRVKPYYLHHPDRAPGTSHFRMNIDEGQNIFGALQGKVSGLCLPHYMLDIPGGFGKIPIAPVRVQQNADGDYHVLDHHGEKHFYASEKGQA
ncbi:MAG: lysine-2,3-aminomutase-like protein [Alphaproteobacteria bacterium]|nr:lysine-2,3-aminomutase-like protein [Alphaproteobacteria bacterium]